MKKINQVVLIRHAQSQWNQQNRFTGWANPKLTETGITEAIAAAKTLKNQAMQFDVAFSSYLQRSKHTLDLLLNGLRQNNIPTHQDWRLNERHYGALQGFNKSEATEIYGDQQIHRWRRGYHDKPEVLSKDDPNHPLFDEMYKYIPQNLLPEVESLADTQVRVMQFWQERVVPLIRDNQRILISAHGNTLRALIMQLSGMSIAEVEQFEIPTATPIAYLFDHQAKPIDWQYLENTHRYSA